MSTETDRELLEWAAKAAGIHPRKLSCGGPSGQVWIEENDRWEKGWDPLTDDGDALRLMAKLRIDLCRPNKHHDAVCAWVDHLSDFIEEPEGNDAAAATRRAITRAAAEIGKVMP